MNDETRSKMKVLNTRLKKRESQDPADFKVGALVRWRERGDGFGVLLERASDSSGLFTETLATTWRVQWFGGPYNGEKGWTRENELEVVSK